MNWAQERAFDIALMTQPWHKLERFTRGELAGFALALMERIKAADIERQEQLAERNEQIQRGES